MKQKLRYLIGAPTQYTLENRIFNAMIIIVLVVIAYNVPFNYFAGLKETSLIFLFLLFAFSGIYYLSRFRQRLQLGIGIAGVLINIMLALNYFFAAGIQGASLLSFTMAFFLIIAVSHRGQYLWWMLLNLATVLGMLALEYFYPQLVMNTYKGKADPFIDIASTYIITIVVIFIATAHIKKAYNAEKRQAEEKAQVLKQLNEEKTKLFSIISHDLRSPLISIRTFLTLMNEAKLDPGNQEKFGAQLLVAVSNTQEMLNNLLSWSRTQMGGLSVYPDKVNILECVEAVAGMQEPLARKKAIRLEYEIDPSLAVFADINMLQLILRNLLNNAIKFTPQEGVVKVRAERQAGECLISVQDTGSGVDEEVKDRIFTLKMESTYGTGNEKGVGLGLFLCREYAHAQNGRIWFESSSGKGSTFYLALPPG